MCCSDVEVPVEQPKTLKLRPLGDRILVKVVEAQETMQNGLVIPDMAVERPMEGVVVAVGNGRVVNGERIPVDVSVGSLVTFGRYSGNEVKVLGQKMLLLSEDELFGEYYSE